MSKKKNEVVNLGEMELEMHNESAAKMLHKLQIMEQLESKAKKKARIKERALVNFLRIKALNNKTTWYFVSQMLRI